VPSPSRAALAFVAALAVTGGAVAAGVAVSAPSSSSPRHPAARPPATPLASIDTTTVGVRRAAFCDAVPAAEVHAAVPHSSPTAAAWSNGDLLSGTRDVAHEFGCSWTAASGPVVSAWVFAPPVTVQRGQDLVASARAQRGCSPLPGAAAFGSPSVALTCTAGGTTTVSYRGLFGDAWLVCQVSGSPATGAGGVADRWCASVLRAARR
jgi:hypothetical protein